MTCIVGLIDPFSKAVYIGGDSFQSSGYYQYNLSSVPKVFRNADFLIATAGLVRVARVLQYSFTPPEIPPEMSLDHYMNTLFIDAMREALKEAGVAKKDEEAEKHENEVLVGYQGRLFKIDSRYAVCEYQHGYAAIGVGEELALGSLYSTRLLDLASRERVLLALETAEAHSSGVKAPFTVLKLPYREEEPDTMHSEPTEEIDAVA